ncbi:MAG: hypothetical protein WC182_01965 [Bacilli bacterium]|jgi:hypothetical protein
MKLNKGSIYLYALFSYVEKTLGIKPKLEPWKNFNTLPLYLIEQYSFYRFRMFSSDILLFIDNSEDKTSPGVIFKHCKTLTDYWSGGIIYSRSSITSTDRTRLIQAKVPFIVPDKQLYIPFLGIDMKELFPPARQKDETLSPTSQVLILGKLYKTNWIEESPSKMANSIGITNMSIGRAFSELELHDLITIKLSGKEKTLEFYEIGKELWNRVLPLLKSPVTSTLILPYSQYNDSVLAGESALSHYSMLNEPRTPTIALFNRSKTIQKTNEVQGRIPNEDLIVQKWGYNPDIFAKKGIADPLSVFLQCKDSNDERIEEALDELIKEIKW